MRSFSKIFYFLLKLISSSPKSHYLFIGSFILGWWMIAFRPIHSEKTFLHETSQSFALQTQHLLRELSPLQRENLKQALAGNFSLMLNFINQWDQDALRLLNKGIKGIQRLPAETFHQAQILGYLLENSTSDSLHHLNCKMNLETMVDDHGHLLEIKDHFQYFLPQTHIAATFLLSIASPKEIVALPKGFRHLKAFHSEILALIPEDIDQLSSEKLSLKKPDIAFIAPYSHPPSLEIFQNQQIPLFSIKHIDTVDEIQEALLKVGHASNHILEAQLLAIFMEASFLSLDNRLLALEEAKEKKDLPLLRLLFLSQRLSYTQPTTKCLSGQLMVRALKQCPSLLSSIPESQDHWHIPFEQEQLMQSAPDCMIISTTEPFSHQVSTALNQTQASLSKRIFYLDESIQESPTQYIVLAYFDIYQALSVLYL